MDKKVYACVIGLYLCVAGCDNIDSIKKMFAAREPEKVPTKIVVVLCDMSGSAKKFMMNYYETFKQILGPIPRAEDAGKIKPRFSNGDRLVVVKITEASITDPEIPLQASFTTVTQVKSGNKMRRKIEEQQMIKELIPQYEAVLKKAEQLFLETANIGTNRRPAPLTDIMSSLSIAEKLFKSSHKDIAMLVILSDMIEESKGYDFNKEKFSDARIQQILDTEKANNRFPDLHGVKVYVVAPTIQSSERFFQIQKFWLQYFAAAGAILPKEHYSNTLLGFQE